MIGSRARTLQPDLGAPCRRTDADLRGLHLFEASRSSERLSRTVSTAVGSANLIRVHSLLAFAGYGTGRSGSARDANKPSCSPVLQRRDLITRCGKGDGMTVRCGTIHGRPRDRQSPKHRPCVRAGDEWCRIALTRLSCETRHKLDQLTVRRLSCCENRRSSPQGKKSCWDWLVLLQRRWWGWGPSSVPRQSSAGRLDSLGVSRLKLNGSRQTLQTGRQSSPTKAERQPSSQKQDWSWISSRSAMSITLDRRGEQVQGRDGRQDLDCFSGTATAYAEVCMQVCPAGTRVSCQPDCLSN